MTKEKEKINIERLKGTQKVRKRVEVLCGSNTIDGVSHILFEAVSNSTDESKKGYGNEIIVTKHLNGSYSIQDNGRGIPITWNKNENVYDWQLIFATLYAGSNYNENDKFSLGLNGIGNTLLNASSEYCNVISCYGGKSYQILFKDGRVIEHKFDTSDGYIVDERLFDNHNFLFEDTDIDISYEDGNIFKVRDCDINYSGTIINYKPDNSIFTNIDIPSEWISNMLREQASVNSGITYIFNEETTNGLETETYYYENGIIDYLNYMVEDIYDINIFSGQGEGADTDNSEVYTCKFDLAFGIGKSDNILQCFHNSSKLEYDGSTSNAIESAFTSEIHNLIKSKGEYKAKEKRVKFNDISNCLSFVINSFSSSTSYENQTKKAITNPFITSFVTQSIKDKLCVIFTEQPMLANKIVKQVLINKRARETSEQTRLNITKKLTENTKTIASPEGFVDCISTDSSLIELYLVEGKSALGAIVKGRNANNQAVTHVGGKMLSCHKATLEKAFNNDVIVRTLKLFGCGIEFEKGCKNNQSLISFDINKLKWNKIILGADEDVDGKQIICLMLVFIYRFCPQLLKQGYVYLAESPLFEIEIKNQNTRFAFSNNEKDEITTKLNKDGIAYKLNRNKGLGQMNPTVVSESMMNPNTRRLIQITVNNDDDMHDIFDLWLGNDSSVRYKELVKNFNDVEVLN